MFSYAQRRKQTVYYLSVNIGVRAYYFYSSRNPTTSCQYKLSKKLVQRIIEAQSVLPSQSRNKTSVPVFYGRIKYPYLFGCMLLKHSCQRTRALIHTHPNSYLYFILRYRCFISYIRITTFKRVYTVFNKLNSKQSLFVNLKQQAVGTFVFDY